jgi:transcriptional regulator with XRE-family HTH domain
LAAKSAALQKIFDSLLHVLSLSWVLKGDGEVELSKQIKELRARDGLSQEALAERIYVTRQTVSNWETERSYPDVQSLLMLSVLFNVSLDELVKGDIEMMKSEIGRHRVNVWTTIMIVFLALGAIAAVPLVFSFGWPGVLCVAVLLLAGLVAALIVGQIKKKHNIRTFAEILEWAESDSADQELISWSKKHLYLQSLLKIIGGAAIGIVLTLICVYIWLIQSGWGAVIRGEALYIG